MRTRYRIAVLLATAAIVLAACSSGGGTAAPSAAAPSEAAPSAGAPSVAPASAAAGGEPVTVDWWHITTGEPGKADFQAAADRIHGGEPRTSPSRSPSSENEAFKTKLSTTAAADYPDLFQSWGGGHHGRRRPTPALLKDITADIAGLEGHDQPRAR
jgi:raffinose/stachyose/melibiose transport system substrate-binding protein